MKPEKMKSANSKDKTDHSLSKKLERFAMEEHCGGEGEVPKNRSHAEIYTVCLEIMIDRKI